MSDFNASVIEEFRANEGKVGGPFDGAPLLILHHVGAKSGEARETPLVYQPLGDSLAIFGSLGGAPTNPAWFHNVSAHPDVEIEIGTERRAVRARVADADERGPIWEEQKRRMPGFAEYEAKTTRVIPVVILEDR